ncbi:MAG: oxidoreductase [Parcubacteria group bacterium]|nr:oxidoreductase [Parcubacteria group bacterium]
MQKENRQFLPVAVIVAGALIAAAIYFGGSGSAGNYGPNTLTGSQDSVEIAPVTSKDHILGDPSAKIVMVEYSDTECPFCKVFHSTLGQIMDTYKDTGIAWVYRQFPIVELHARAPKEAEATECVAEQGGNAAFWAFINKVFATTGSNDSLDPAELPIIAQSVGLDVTAFNTCVSSGKYTNVITNDVAAAYKTGAQGTPYTVIQVGSKKSVIVGAQDYDTVKAAIDDLLKP